MQRTPSTAWECQPTVTVSSKSRRRGLEPSNLLTQRGGCCQLNWADERWRGLGWGCCGQVCSFVWNCGSFWISYQTMTWLSHDNEEIPHPPLLLLLYECTYVTLKCSPRPLEQSLAQMRNTPALNVLGQYCELRLWLTIKAFKVFDLLCGRQNTEWNT